MTSNLDNPIYKQFYGQDYNYDLEDGTSSGVAAYEPNGSKENPLVEPFYDIGDKLVAPKETNYTEKPFGESFFPSASVTYSRVTVQNLERVDPDEERAVIKHATGKVVSEFYTCRDFPTKTDFTDITPLFDPPGPLGSILNLSVRNHLTFSQGFVVETNDMNGRMKSQNVFAEGQTAPISGVDYYYNTDANNQLSSTVTTINKDGTVNTEDEIGLTYDVFNDFRENYSESTTVGVDFNIAGFVIFIWPVIIPAPIPDYAYHETRMRTATTTKVIHRSAIMTQKVARDLGSSVSTEYLAWDAHTGQALLTQTINEYDDHYYNFTYPSHWYYQGMDMATINVGASGVLTKDEEVFHYTSSVGSDIFMPGDELLTMPLGNSPQDGIQRMWIADVSSNGRIQLMNREGDLIAYDCPEDELFFKIVRSGYRNQQTASMASVTSQRNPLTIDAITGAGYLFEETDPATEDPRIINASAVAYHEAWPSQWESNLPRFPDVIIDALEDVTYEDTGSPSLDFDLRLYGFNPYLHNVRGEWRAKRSYAYLSGRNDGIDTQQASPRYEGYFDQFNPFYEREGDSWTQDTDNWTFASEVTEYSPYGAELENRDALGRYSAAQYGYNYTLPTAVASNSAYEQIGYDGFEDYSYQTQPEVENDDQHFGFVVNGNTVQRVESTAHTGRYSLKITEPVSLERNYPLENDDDGGFDLTIGDPDCSVDDTSNCSSSTDMCRCSPYNINLPGFSGGTISIGTHCSSSSATIANISGNSITINYIAPTDGCTFSDMFVDQIMISYPTSDGDCMYNINIEPCDC